MISTYSLYESWKIYDNSEQQSVRPQGSVTSYENSRSTIGTGKSLKIFGYLCCLFEGPPQFFCNLSCNLVICEALCILPLFSPQTSSQVSATPPGHCKALHQRHGLLVQRCRLSEEKSAKFGSNAPGKSWHRQTAGAFWMSLCVSKGATKKDSL